MVKKDTHIKSGYRLTEVGVIPVDWEMDSLKNNLKSAPRYGIGAAAVDYSFQLPKYLRITDISEDGYYMPEKMVSVNHPFAKNYYLANGDIVVARTGASVGKSYLYDNKDGELVFAGFLICLKTDETRLIPQFLKNYLQTPQYWNWVKVTSMRSGQPGINGNEYASLNIPLPSKPEQSAIAQALSDTDTLISSLDELIEKKKAIKQGTMQELLTGKKRLSGFSGEWNIVSLGNLGFCYGGLSGKTKKDFGNGNSSYIPFLNIMRSPKIDINYFDTVNIFPGEIQSKASKNDLFFNGSSETPEELGMCSVLVNDIQNLYLNSFCFGFRFKDPSNTDGLFLSYFFRSNEGRKVIYSLAQGATRYNLSKTAFLKAEIKIPCIEEQLGIAQVISDMDSEIYELQKKRDKYKQIKQGMMSELLTGNIRLLGVK